MKGGFIIAIAVVAAACLTYLAIDRVTYMCNSIESDVLALSGDHVVTCEQDSDCALHAVQCPWSSCITNRPVNKTNHPALRDLLSRFEMCSYLPPYRHKENACLDKAAKTDCTRPYRNVSCVHRICVSW